MRRIAAERPDVVLLDLMLPVLDGWAVLADLHSREQAPPVIVCSAKGSPRDLARAQELGAVEFITKPFDMEDVLDTVREVLERFATAGPGASASPDPSAACWTSASRGSSRRRHPSVRRARSAQGRAARLP